MLVSLDGKKNFFARKTLVKGGGLRWLRFVPFAVVFWLGVNVVRGGVAVDDLDLLADHHAEHVRMVFAAALVESDGLFRHIESATAKAVLDIDEHVGEVAAAGEEGSRGVRALAGGVLAHVDFRARGRCALKFDSAGDGGNRGGVDKARGAGPPAGRPAGLRRLLPLFPPPP